MKRFKKILIFILSMVLIATGCAEDQNGTDFEVPEEVSDCLQSYLDALKVSSKDAAPYAYFPNEEIETAYKDSSITLVSYSIEETKKINEDLYAFKLLMEDSAEPGEPYNRWKFVGNIEDEILFIGNVDYIPEELQDGLTAEDFRITDDNTLPQEDVLFG